MTKPSVSAAAIGAGYVATANHPDWSHLTDQETAKLVDFFTQQLIRELNGAGYLFMQTIRLLPYSLQKGAIANITALPGITEHYALRKLLINQGVEKAIAKGIKQIIILGGGCDAHSLIWKSQHKYVKIFEVDYGKTQEVKQKSLKAIETIDQVALSKLGRKLVCKYSQLLSEYSNLSDDEDNNEESLDRSEASLNFIECDLSMQIKDLSDILKRKGFVAEQDTVVIAEGLLVFLSPRELDKLFPEIHKLLGPNGKFIFGYGNNADKIGAVANALQKESKESCKSQANSSDVPRIMKKHGFDIEGQISFAAMQMQVNNPVITKQVERILDGKGLLQENYFVVTRTPQIEEKINLEEKEEKFISNINHIRPIKLKIPPKNPQSLPASQQLR